MTATHDRPQMLPEEFEEYARLAARVAEGVRWEFINGKIGVTPVPDGDHGRIIQWLARICIQAHPDLWLHDQGLKVETYRNGHARPDGTLAHGDAFVGQGEWADADPALMVVEVTSYDSDTDRRDRVEKPRAYAETGIPVYLLVDREAGEVTVFSEPDGVRYESTKTVPFGKPLTLPAPIGVTLDTEPLQGWVR
ncbi:MULTISPECIES: Uma2 family endonuclease [Streptomyces]|uniref:Uma2 family endonuclease n=1 Tax=Streptomyces TaxID=1883 RepID=UPI000F79109B|nr:MULTISPECIES: Uma2 family endonuclease [unclassified Streptomyces]AJZ85054.1 Uma2 family endonuclease [Streptomyces sp. AgN23]RSS45890.1 Uma2 family endonuclease [Streptomyces sp. WAC05858]WTA80775.1 Uma2 family endonuclease [Streptomyces antimycoticus]WTB08784.1 Uma2 family endonuclease [Streptomyces antimycoticus]